MKHLTILFLIFSALGAVAQDQLFKRDNTKLEVKILEISPNEIKYKLFTYQDGPTIIVAKSDIALVIYQNGIHEVFNQQVTQPVIVYRDDYNARATRGRINTDSFKLANFREVTKTKNLISLNLLEVFNAGIGVSYLREFANNYLHVYVPIAIGLSTPYLNQPGNTVFGIYNSRYEIQNFKFDRKTIDAGIGIHLQTSGKRAVTHFIGPYIGMSQFSGSFDTNYNTYPNYDPANITNHPFIMNRYTFMLDNGFLFRITPNFNMMLLAGIGYHVDDFLSNNPTNFNTYNNNYYNYRATFPINSLKLGMSLGYRF